MCGSVYLFVVACDVDVVLMMLPLMLLLMDTAVDVVTDAKKQVAAAFIFVSDGVLDTIIFEWSTSLVIYFWLPRLILLFLKKSSIINILAAFCCCLWSMVLGLAFVRCAVRSVSTRFLILKAGS